MRCTSNKTWCCSRKKSTRRAQHMSRAEINTFTDDMRCNVKCGEFNCISKKLYTSCSCTMPRYTAQMKGTNTNVIIYIRNTYIHEEKILSLRLFGSIACRRRLISLLHKCSGQCIARRLKTWNRLLRCLRTTFYLTSSRSALQYGCDCL